MNDAPDAPAPKEGPRDVSRLRFGIGGEQTLSLVGQEFSLNRERVRQIGSNALRQLRREPEPPKSAA